MLDFIALSSLFLVYWLVVAALFGIARLIDLNRKDTDDFTNYTQQNQNLAAKPVTAQAALGLPATATVYKFPLAQNPSRRPKNQPNSIIRGIDIVSPLKQQPSNYAHEPHKKLNSVQGTESNLRLIKR